MKVTCPVNNKWLKAMLSVIPIDLAKKLEPYIDCLSEDEKKELGLVKEEAEIGLKGD